jgi:hypothetical protein
VRVSGAAPRPWACRGRRARRAPRPGSPRDWRQPARRPSALAWAARVPGAWGEVVHVKPQNREWAGGNTGTSSVALGGAGLHGGYYPDSGYDAALQQVK